MFEGNASYLYVANVARGTDTIEGMANGSVAIVNQQGVVVTTDQTGGNEQLRVAQKLASGQIIYSPLFGMGETENKEGISFVAPQQQVSYWGYNGVSGALDEETNKSYTLHLEWKNSQFTVNNTAMTFSGTHYTKTADQAELASGLINSLYGAIKGQPYPFVKIERVSDGTLTALPADADVINGLTAVGCVAHALSVGDAVSLNGATYLVKEVLDVDNFVIDSPYAGISETITAGANASSVASITAWGLKFTGQENVYFDAVNDVWQLVRFDLTSGDFDVAEITKDTPGLEGTGYGKLVANKEVYAQFLDKSPVISAYPRNIYRDEVDVSGEYDVISFEVIGITFVSPTTGKPTIHTYGINIATKVALDGDDVDTVFGVSV